MTDSLAVADRTWYVPYVAQPAKGSRLDAYNCDLRRLLIGKGSPRCTLVCGLVIIAKMRSRDETDSLCDTEYNQTLALRIQSLESDLWQI
jgi:hypothetical protein